MQPDEAIVATILHKIGDLEAVMFSVLDGLQLVGNFVLQVCIGFDDVERLSAADQFDGVYTELIGHSSEGNNISWAHVDQGLHCALHGKYNLCSLGVVAMDRRGLSHLSLVVSEIHFESDFSLAPGRDCAVVINDRTPSTRVDFDYLQIGLPSVLHNEVVRDLTHPIDHPEVIFKLGEDD